MAKTPGAAPAAARKPRAPRKTAAPAAAPLAEGAAPAADLPDTGAAAPGDALKLKALVAQVTAASGGKGKGVKEIVVATLAALGNALSSGQNLNLPPLGKARVGRQKGVAGNDAELIVVKLRRGGGKKMRKKDVTEGVAAAEE